MGGVDVIWQCGTNAICATGNSIHVLGNYFHDIATALGGASGGVIQLPNIHGGTSPDAQVIGNVLDHSGPYPNCPTNQAQGIYIATANGIVYNNIVTRTCYAGIHYYDQACGARISNNVSANNVVGIVLYGQNGCTAGFNSVINNVVDNNSGQAFNLGTGPNTCTTGKPELFSNNIVFGNGSVFSSTPSCLINQNQLSENPTSTFVNYTGDSTGNYQLKGTSIAVNGGVSQCVTGGVTPCTPATDFVGVARPQRTAPDVGAFELP